MRRALTALGIMFVTACAGCFDPDQPTCSYVCSESEPRCPQDYECRADNYCHLVGSVAECGFSDAGVSIDLSASAPDLAQPADLSESD
jgi:hypothetical protein